jgi:hypothetical protein
VNGLVLIVGVTNADAHAVSVKTLIQQALALPVFLPAAMDDPAKF